MEFFATCPTGFEQLLADELRRLGVAQIRPLRGQTSFAGELVDAYRVCLWSRLSSRVVAVLERCDARNSDEIYEGASSIAWEEHILPTTTFAIDVSGTNDQLKNTQFTAMRVKDAVADRLMATVGTRASVDARNPHIRILVRIARNRATIGIDLAGAPLFNRGYERGKVWKGLRPDYAAALLQLAGWPIDEEGESAFVALGQYPDSLIVEAACMTADYAPGLTRANWGFVNWLHHDSVGWEQLQLDARSRARNECSSELATFSFGKSTSMAKSLLRSLGITASIRTIPTGDFNACAPSPVLAADLSDIRPHEVAKEASWLGTIAQAVQKTEPARLVLASRNNLPEAYVGKPSTASITSMLGREELQLQFFDHLQDRTAPTTIQIKPGVSVSALIPASDQFAARLKKIARIRSKWATREDVSCYRVYDADLPDYAVTLDLFQGSDPNTGELNGKRWLQIYEYAAPKDVDATLARSRLMDVLAIAPPLLGVREQDTFLRVRRRDKGGSQYADEAKHLRAYSRVGKDGRVPLPEGAHLIDEGGLTFEVNFSGRLDCGIFLDHRDTRALLREMAKQTQGSKRFLNLFAYTGTATCYAADGGMRHTTTVDLSRPSLDWAQRNMTRNGFVGHEHEYVQADVVSWIREQRRTKNRWDLVFCDVPTFSNSNRMGRRSFDVQRDHAELLIGVSRLLTRNGCCVFSCNLRTFKPDEAALAKAGVTIEDITDKTIPEDFQRNKRVHHAYVVKRTGF